jgi:hypothetical protein
VKEKKIANIVHKLLLVIVSEWYGYQIDFFIFYRELMAAQAEHRRKMSKFLMAQVSDMDIEDTIIGRIRIKLSRLMANKTSGITAFKREVEKMKK